MLLDVGEWGVTESSGRPIVISSINENWILAVTRHRGSNILLTRNLHFDSDVRQWSHALMVLLHCLSAKSNYRTVVSLNVTWFVFVLILFIHIHDAYDCSFVAKLGWKKMCFFLKKYYKIYIICRKNFFTRKKNFYNEIFFIKNNFFYREKYKWKCKKYVSRFWNILLHRNVLYFK